MEEKIAYTQAQLREEEGLKKEMVKQLHVSRRKQAEAEEQAKELTTHVERLIDQLKAEGKDPNESDPRALQDKKGGLSPKGGQKGGLLGKVNELKMKQDTDKMSAKQLMKRGGASLPTIKT